jgi:glycerol-3-phosphate dehydrogenase (NAD+)
MLRLNTRTFFLGVSLLTINWGSKKNDSSMTFVDAFHASLLTSSTSLVSSPSQWSGMDRVFGVPNMASRQAENEHRTSSLSSSTMLQSSTRGSANNPPGYPVRIAVMGGGNFGLAIASICARQGHPTTILVRGEDIVEQINTQHMHPRYMKGIKLPTRVRATTDPAECLPDATYIVHAVPCQYSRKFLEGVKQHIPPNTPILSVSKGIETSSLGFMADILRETLGETRPLAFLSGPSFAREIIQGVATAVVIASEDLDLARDLAALLSDANFKCFTSQDVVGVEIGGAVKNVIALGAGMCEGLELGTNAMSGLVTRGCNEMRRLGLAFGARPSTIAGLSGTCIR